MSGEVSQFQGNRLIYFIQAQGYKSIEIFASQHGFEKSALSKIIRGQRIPRVDTLIKLAHALNLTLNDFYLETESVKDMDVPYLSK
jgi:transcriptional regulator with XRE-family HTH domain